MRNPFINPPASILLPLLWLSFITGCAETGRENTLSSETSPYLLQHAENPVQWQAWGDTVWEMAKKEDKLVLISIGYASCHWCHVMEEETFEDDSVAAFMNERFINVKVDREERPDVDQVYMTAVQLMGGAGGWPLNVLALPNGKPLYGGTYHTRENWVNVLGEIDSLYRADPDRAAEYADKVAEGIAQTNLVPVPEAPGIPGPEDLAGAVSVWQGSWDPEWGGEQVRQKFMLPSNLAFLMEYAYLSGDPGAKQHLENTLEQIARGGVYDHIGGGFFRYSTDPQWRVPHFEKMLYDTAQLIGIYAKAYRYLGREEYRRLVSRSVAFLKRELKSDAGGYYSAMDADSEGEEGRYYVWSASELQALLGAEYGLFSDYYQVGPGTAWEHGQYVLRRSGSDKAFAARQGLDVSGLRQRVDRWHALLQNARSGRIRPATDRKIITSWNALLVEGLCEAYWALGREEYLQEAESLYSFLKSALWQPGGLAHAYTDGVVQQEGFLEDYAYLGIAAFRLYQASGEVGYLTDAQTLLEEIRERFGMPDSPLFRFTEESELIASIVKTDDGVLPAPNTAVAELMGELGHFFYAPEQLSHSREMLQTLFPSFLNTPQYYGGWGRLALREAYPYYEVAVVGPDAAELALELQAEYIPNSLCVFSNTPSELPLFEMRFTPEATSVFVCRDHACKMPVQTAAAAWEQLQEGQEAVGFEALQ